MNVGVSFGYFWLAASDAGRGLSLYEAAALAIAEFRRCGFTANAPGPVARLTVTVKAPAPSHEVQWGKIEAWLQSGGKSPAEQALEVRLRELLGA